MQIFKAFRVLDEIYHGAHSETGDQMAFSPVTVIKPVYLSVSVKHHEKVVLVNMAMLPLFAAELYALISKHGLRSQSRKVPLHILLVQDGFVIVKQVFLLNYISSNKKTIKTYRLVCGNSAQVVNPSGHSDVALVSLLHLNVFISEKISVHS